MIDPWIVKYFTEGAILVTVVVTVSHLHAGVKVIKTFTAVSYEFY
jgi:hypothetical protein